ncbi:MAG: hypothetical protein OXT09_28675 [Myxococcales bacterium]|nr:hypothetical protein [Myxococcales bacterium]
MRTILVCLSLGMAVLATSAPAAAQKSMGRDGTFVLGVERVFGFVTSTTSSEATVLGQDQERDATTTGVTLLASAGVPSAHVAPRLAFDYFLATNISIGAALGYGTGGGEVETTVSTPGGSASSTDDQPDQSLFMFHARGGYFLPFGGSFGFWPKLGFSYFTIESGDGSGEVSVDGFALNLDAALVIELAPHFGLSLAGLADIGLGGEAELDLPGGGSTDADTTVTDFGLMAGIYGYL